MYTVLKWHSALWRQPRGWCGPQWKWVWHPDKRMKCWFMLLRGCTSDTSCYVTKVHRKWPQMYCTSDRSKIGESTENKVDRCWPTFGVGRVGVASEVKLCWQLHRSLNILKLYTVNGWILWYVNYMTNKAVKTNSNQSKKKTLLTFL